MLLSAELTMLPLSANHTHVGCGDIAQRHIGRRIQAHAAVGRFNGAGTGHGQGAALGIQADGAVCRRGQVRIDGQAVCCNTQGPGDQWRCRYPH